MSRRPTDFSPVLLLLSLAAFPLMARAQTGVSPEAAPAAPEATAPQINPTGPQQETTSVGAARDCRDPNGADRNNSSHGDAGATQSGERDVSGHDDTRERHARKSGHISERGGD